MSNVTYISVGRLIHKTGAIKTVILVAMTVLLCNGANVSTLQPILQLDVTFHCFVKRGNAISMEFSWRNKFVRLR